jgi:hypothetical protein
VGTWENFQDNFSLLANEQRGIPESEWLCIYRDRNPRERGPFSSREMGGWTISNGPSRLFRKKFERLANHAGAKLGPLHSPRPIYFGPPEPSVSWINSLYDYLLDNLSPLLVAPVPTRETIKSVCQASADFCAYLADSLGVPERGREITKTESSRAQSSANAAQSPRHAEAELGDVLTAIGARRGSGGWVSAALGNGVKDQPFVHSEDYRTVTVRGETCTLTSEQAAMIQILHKAHKNGTPDISIAHILEELGKKSSRWQDTFKSNPTAKRALVRSGNRKGTLRLNL